LIGSVLQRNALARWCDALAIASDGGLPLPDALRLAGDLVGWTSIRLDTQAMIDSLQSGASLQLALDERWRVLPPAVAAALDLASQQHQLPFTAHTLADMYARQAEERAAALSAVISPIALLTVAIMVLIVIGGLLTPILRLITAFTS
jgi:type II secretory pathway component PulF